MSLADRIRSIHNQTGWGRGRIHEKLTTDGVEISPATVGRMLRAEKAKGRTVVSLTDWHIPYHDEAALKAAFAFCEKVQPEVIVIHEVHDFYSLSRFDQDPERQDGLQAEIDIAVKYFRELRDLCPNAKIILLESNHLDRLRKYLWSKAQALNGLRALRLESLLELDKLNIYFMPNYTEGGIIFKHGDLVNKFSAYTAKNELDKEGTSGLTGHTHRLGTHYRTRRGGKYVWVECGCLCDLDPEYITGVPDWQHGIGVVQFEAAGSQYYAQAVPIIDGKILWGGELIK